MLGLKSGLVLCFVVVVCGGASMFLGGFLLWFLVIYGSSSAFVRLELQRLCDDRWLLVVMDSDDG